MPKAQKGRKLAPPYPWTEWFGRVKFTIHRGRDYKCMPHSMAQMVRNTASKLGLKSPKIDIHPSGQIDVNLEGKDDA